MANINIYGKLYNNTVDKIIAGAEQIWDTTQNKMQDVINAELYAASGDIEGMIGQPDGIAGLDSDGKVPSSQLPSYVDDVLEYDNQSAFPKTGESGKIYVAKDTNKTYRWSGSAYVEISQSLALGETSSTAYAGDKGAANRAAISSLPSTIVSSISRGTVSANAITLNVNRVTKSGLNYGSAAAANFDIPSATSTAAGLMSASMFNKLNTFENVESNEEDDYFRIPAQWYYGIGTEDNSTGHADEDYLVITTDGIRWGYHNSNGDATEQGNITFDKLKQALNKLDGLNEDPIQSFTIQNTNNGTTSKTYKFAINTNHTADLIIPTGSVMEAGLLSANDKAKLDGIAENANLYVLPAATSSALGGVRIGATGLSEKQYAVQLNSSNQMFVSVPWTDTKYNLPVASASILGGIKVGAGLAITAEGVLSATGGGEADSVAWANVSGKPSEFNPPLASTTVRGGVKINSDEFKMNGEVLQLNQDGEWYSHLAHKAELDGYLPLTGGELSGTLYTQDQIQARAFGASYTGVTISTDEGSGGKGKIVVSDSTNNITITGSGIAKNGGNATTVYTTNGGTATLPSVESIQNSEIDALFN